MQQEVTRDNLRQINRLFYTWDGLPLLLKENRQVNEANEIQKAFAEIDLAVKKARQLESLNPLYRGRLVHALSNRALVEDDILKRAEYALECYEALLKILKDMDVKAETAGNLRNIGGEFSNAVYNISMFTRKKDRKAVFEKVYGDGTDAKAKPAQKEKKRGLFRRR